MTPRRLEDRVFYLRVFALVVAAGLAWLTFQAQPLEVVVAGHADQQRNGDQRERDQPAVGQPEQKLPRRDNALRAMLESG